MEEKKYHIDNEPASARDIIRKAREYGYEGSGGFYLSSQASDILREHGHIVGDIKVVEIKQVIKL